ncbi:alcohol dehydrogenase catalytic domain-containing protein [Virgisporangium aurantiacum]|uniref:NADPH:quinone reductase n=1 Tax=Virgisporangium aurantiacum TaxID=175570 RepID=A0A8J3ZHL8_9ACTN|nr:zinc-binding dehydrogenase [Virgisporangium aurantiacum]GIJ64064.1 NADPH:quinone reductase [Virgisporangium aurantiacum]
MRALVTSAGTDTPVLADVEAAPVGPADLRIRISAAAVNPIDVFLATERGRAVFGLSGGTGLGSDLTGTVVEAGPQVDGFAVGDRVAALDRDPTAPSRAHADSIVVASADVARIPAGLDPLAAASIPLNALAARQGLDLIGPPAGRSLLVTGAAGAVGGYAVALAASAGWRVTGLARATDADFVRNAGAERLVHELPGPTYDVVLDAAALLGNAVRAVRDNGVYVGYPGQAVEGVRGVQIKSVVTRPDGAALGELLRLAADGLFQLRIAGTVPLTAAAEAYATVAGGGQRGRWLLVP